MDAADPLCAVSSATSLLRRTLGGPAPAASPSKADDALLRGISGTLKGSKELIEQAKILMKEHTDIRMVYQDDGGKAVAAVNCKNNQLGRRPTGERKRHRFTMRVPASKALPVIDRSVLDTISDPDEYFAMEAQLDKAEAEIKRLSGVVQAKKTLNFEPVVERKRRTSSQRRKSYFFSSDTHTTNANMIPASQSGNMIESQTSQDGAHASVSDKNEQSVPSRYNDCAISGGFVQEDSFAEKGKGDEITDIMASFQNFDGPDRLDFLRKTIGIGEIRMEKNYGCDLILGDMSFRSAAQTNPQQVYTLERSLSGSHQARVSELAERIFRDATMDKHDDLCKDAELEDRTLETSLPGTHQTRVSELAEHIFRDAAMNEHTDLLDADETFSARRKDRESPCPSSKSPEHVLDPPEPNMPDCAVIYDDPCSRHNVSVEEDSVPMDYTTTDKFNNEAVIASHHLEDASTEMLAHTPARNVAPENIARTSHSSVNNIQHQEVFEEDGVVQDTSLHSLEIPNQDIGPKNQSQAPDGTNKKLAADLRNALSPTKKTQKMARRGKTGQQPKRGKKVADVSCHSLEVPQEDFDSENQLIHHVNTAELAADLRNALSPAKDKTEKTAEKGKIGPQSKRGKKMADESHHSVEIPQEDFDSENHSTHHETTEGLITDLRNALSPTREKIQKAAQRVKNKQQSERMKKVADESSHSPEIPQVDSESENQPPTYDVNTEQQTVVMRNALSPNKPKGHKDAQRRSRPQKLNKRKSLADAGLEWQSGVRRSTRIRHRPLEHWRGERFVYGRIHETMVTVIGVKSYSPDEGGKIALKVKSFVPEQYSDIVAECAKY